VILNKQVDVHIDKTRLGIYFALPANQAMADLSFLLGQGEGVLVIHGRHTWLMYEAVIG
jgi:hypothetical protein